MTQNKQELTRLIKDISITKKSIEKAQAAIKTKRSMFDTQLRDVEKELGITNYTLIEIGRVAVRYFGWTISADKLEEELDLIFSDKTILEYVEGEKKNLPFADALAELDKVFGGSADKPKKEEAVNASEADTDAGAATVSDSMNKSGDVSGDTT
ncbi:MAG: hypothetical protein K6C68_02910 [Ruminococcus sp.]|nr:hypothetical protein [Ruminococcus sp.]